MTLGMPPTLLNTVEDSILSWLQYVGDEGGVVGCEVTARSQVPVPMAEPLRLPTRHADVDDTSSDLSIIRTRFSAKTPSLVSAPSQLQLQLESASDSSQSSGRTSRRSKSLVMKVADLRMLKKPVQYCVMTDSTCLTDELHHLLDAVYAHDYHTTIFPDVIKNEIVAALSSRSAPPNHAFYSTDARNHNPKDSADVARAQLLRLQEIVSLSLESTDWARSEPAWRLLVHWPVLKEALSDVSNVALELM